MRIFGLAFDVRCGATFSILMQRDPENLGDFPHRFNFFTELPILGFRFGGGSPSSSCSMARILSSVYAKLFIGVDQGTIQGRTSFEQWLGVVAGWGDEQRIRLLLGDV